MKRDRFFLMGALLRIALGGSAPRLWGQAQDVFRADFEKADAGDARRPAGWVSSDAARTEWGRFGRNGSFGLRVKSTPPEDAVVWRAPQWKLQPNTLYRLSFWARGAGGEGTIVSGPDIVNRDFPLSTQWTQHETYFRTSSVEDANTVRLGTWNTRVAVDFDGVQIVPVQSLELQGAAGVTLGRGESIEGDRYVFRLPQSTNDARPLHSATARFNTDRWALSGDGAVIYRHEIGSAMQRAATVRAGINYYAAGRAVLEASSDGQNWQTLAQRADKGEMRAVIPATMLPARVIWIRLRALAGAANTGDSSPGALQINDYEYSATLDKNLGMMRGDDAMLLAVEKQNEGAPVQLSLHDGAPTQWRIGVGGAPRPLKVSAQWKRDGRVVASRDYALKAGAKNPTALPFPSIGTGLYAMSLQVRGGKNLIYSASGRYRVAAIQAENYGARVQGAGDVWWSASQQNVGRARALPPATSVSTQAALQLAKNEYEALQIVARPTKKLSDLRVSVGDLKNEKGVILSAKNIAIHEVAYVPVRNLTDETSAFGEWPDPLPLHKKPLAVEANRNQPFWLSVYAPPSTQAGVYRGAVRLQASGWSRIVPLEVRVYNFALPQETHLETAFGFNTDWLRRYHKTQTPQQLEEVREKYLDDFAAHRVSPYASVTAPIEVDWGLGELGAWNGGQTDNTTALSGSSIKLVDSSTSAPLIVEYAQPVPIHFGKKYTLRFAARTEKPNQIFLVSLSTHDKNGNWISGHNIDVNRTGDGTWQKYEIDVTPLINEKATAVRPMLHATRWTEGGTEVGTVWFDDVQLLDENGKNLLLNSGFDATDNVSADNVKLDFTAFDKAAEKAFRTRRFTTYLLPLPGMGGGDYTGWRKGKIGPFEEGAPQYETLMGSFLRQAQAHLIEKGWIDRVYTYWFDEPEEKHYPFVRAGMDRLKKYAPRIRRMLTEQPEKELEGAVNLWCPVSPYYDEKTARRREAAGDRFWWYICTVPKTPYATEFIDHPAVELRTWIWQTWQRKIDGVLIWDTIYWSSPTAFPNTLQNPWNDAASWAADYTAPGAKYNWGNGDGRFFYPPRRDPNTATTPDLSGPITSMRWETLRDGIEDYEYFWMLRDKIAKAKKRKLSPAQRRVLSEAESLLKVPSRVTKSATEFATEVAPILAHRAKLAAAIERVSAMK